MACRARHCVIERIPVLSLPRCGGDMRRKSVQGDHAQYRFCGA
jgi:hypothetical protein